MSTTMPEGRVSPFRWNAGAWFGSQLGGTLWLLVGSAVLLARAPLAAVVWAVSFALANALGLVLWAARGRVGMYAALQSLLLGLGVVSLASLAVADWCGQLPGLTSGSANPRVTAYGAWLVLPGLMVIFWLRERFGKVVDESGRMAFSQDRGSS
jgi:hypothetical protein